MNWPWIIGGGLFGALTSACLAYPLLMLAMHLDLRRRPATEASDGMAWAPLVAIWMSTVAGLPIGAVGGAYWAWRHPEYAAYAVGPFTILGSLCAIPLVRLAIESWWADWSTPPELRPPRTAMERLRDAFQVSNLIINVPPWLALALAGLGIRMGGWVYALPAFAFWGVMWSWWRRVNERKAEAIDAEEFGRFLMKDGSTLIVQSISYYPLTPDLADLGEDRNLTPGFTYRAPEGTPSRPGGSLFLTCRLDPERTNGFTLSALLSDAEEPNVGVLDKGLGGSWDAVGRSTLSCDFANFPRRASTLTCRILDETEAGYEEQVAFSFPNPDHGDHPRWTASELPITREAGGVSVTLLSFKPASPPAGVHWPSIVESAQGRLVFDLRYGGVSSTDWEPKLINVCDATGNRFGNYNRGYGWEDGLLHLPLVFTHGVCDDVWKLQVQFVKRKDAPLEPGEGFAFPEIPIPSDGETISIDQEGVVGAWRLRIVSILGSGAPIPKSQAQPGGPKRTASPALLLDLERLVHIDDGYRPAPELTLRNGEGWSEEPDLWHFDYASREPSRQLVSVNCPEGSNALSLSIEARNSLSVEYLVRV
jgi:hypothetical protein